MMWCNVNTIVHDSKNAIEWWVNDRYTIITTAIEQIHECLKCANLWNCEKKQHLISYLDEDVKG